MAASDFYIGGFFGSLNNQFSPESRCFDQKPSDNHHFAIDDLLDFPKEDEVMTDAFFDSFAGNSTDSSTLTAVDSCNSSVSGNISCRSFADAQFAGELCVPYDDLAELEWLSNIVEESFSSDDLQNLQLISGAKQPPTDTSSSETTQEIRRKTTSAGNHSPAFLIDVSVPGKARSKRPRAAPCDWSSRLLLLSPATPPPSSAAINKYASKTTPSRASETTGRRCLHCGSEKTPQWRAGPMGPKTLCNACGVRFKSGRLVPEYRPAASPTFLSTKHSNSHRKVLELRRQKELHQQCLSQTSVFRPSNGDDDYLIHHRNGPDFRRMI
ncbi:GATA transcription factor 12-like [Cornus florida]|uniref:GATA transcription factor 12-like n=1 Tax=Cornus florida TaxID=4283 RepID=UPI00289EBEAC|nr:GATA transcription factor 12-like [Cornus florida]